MATILQYSATGLLINIQLSVQHTAVANTQTNLNFGAQEEPKTHNCRTTHTPENTWVTLRQHNIMKWAREAIY